MCSRGIYQLKQLQIIFCDYGGSSARIREYLPSIAESYLLNQPKIDVKLFIKRGTHPFLKAYYINGFEKQISLRNIKTEEEVLQHIALLRNSFGQQSLPHAGRKVYTTSPSIQGKWNETLFPQTKHEMEIERYFPALELPEGELVPTHRRGKNDYPGNEILNHMYKAQRGQKVSGDF